MRILVVSNLYPPYFVGGYELGCQDVVEVLRARGHQVKVLTSTYGTDKPRADGDVCRWLMFDPCWPLSGPVKPLAQLLASGPAAQLLARETNNQNAFKRVCAEFKPDIVYAWNLKSVSFSLVFLAESLGLPVCYFVSDNWLAGWENDAWCWYGNYRPRGALGHLRKRLVRLLARTAGLVWGARSPDLRHTQFASRYLRQFAVQAGKPVAEAVVIHWGIDVNRYPYKKHTHTPKRLLYVGRIAPHKGTQTVIEALKILAGQPELGHTTLTVVGGGLPDDEAAMRTLADALGVGDKVHFRGMLAREALIPIYQEHDILVFPSVHDEPFGITPLEAMASGLALVSTATGGSPEILEDEGNALIFPKEDAEACAAQIRRLLEHDALFDKIRRNARCAVEERFTFDAMVDRIESELGRAAAERAPEPADVR